MPGELDVRLVREAGGQFRKSNRLRFPYGIVNQHPAPIVFCPRVSRIFYKERLGVYGEHHLHRAARVNFFDGAHGLAYALGAHLHPARSGFFVHLNEDPYHPF
jgi:hypothetical protein